MAFAMRRADHHVIGQILDEKLVRTERSLQLRASGIADTCHLTQDRDHDCNYIQGIQITIKPSGLVG